MSEEVKTLEGISDGVWNVYTETSMYVLDLNKMLGKRVPGKGMASRNSSRNKKMPVNELRADNEWFKVVGVYCEVGPGMAIICEGLVPADIYTLRQTSWVQKIEKVEQ
jgi:hypothetical protein